MKTKAFDPLTADVGAVYEAICENPTLEFLNSLRPRFKDREAISKYIGELISRKVIDTDIGLEALKDRPDNSATKAIGRWGEFNYAGKALDILKDRPGVVASDAILAIGLSDYQPEGANRSVFRILVERKDYDHAACYLQGKWEVDAVGHVLLSPAFAEAAQKEEAKTLLSAGVETINHVFGNGEVLYEIAKSKRSAFELSEILREASHKEKMPAKLPLGVDEMQSRLSASIAYAALFSRDCKPA